MMSLSQPTPLSYNQVTDMLLQQGINPTPQRLHIAQLLFKCAQHISAEDIMGVINNNAARVSKATVYNTLNLFVKKGLLREVLIDPNRVFYDSNTSSHHHIYNIDTGELTDICAKDIAISNLPNLPDDQELEGIDLIIKVKNR